MTKLTYALSILICAGVFAACGGSGNNGMTVLPPAPRENLSPVVDRMIPDRNLAVRRSADLDLAIPMRAFRDPEDAVLTYTAESSMPAVVTASTSGNQLTITSVGPTGASDITVTATDPGGLSATQTFTVSVVANTAPMAVGTIPPLEIVTGASQGISLSLHFTDRENDALTYGATSSNNAVATVRASGNGVVVTAVGAGTADITVTASDPDRLSAMQMFTVTASPAVNPNPPFVEMVIPTQNFNNTSSRNIDLSAHFSGGRGALTYRATSLDANIATASVEGSILTIQPEAPSGRTSITATASDADMDSASWAFDVVISLSSTRPPPQTPDLRPGTVIPTQNFDNTASSRNIDLSAHFSGGRGVLTYRATSLNSNIATASVAGSVLTIRPMASGRTSITATASDADMNSASLTFDVVVSRTPVLTAVGSIPNFLFLETEPQAINIGLISYFSNPQGATLTYSASVSGSGAIQASASGNTLSIRQVASGEVTITVRAMNSGGASATQEFMVLATGTRDLANYIQRSNYLIPSGYMNALMFGHKESVGILGGRGANSDVIRINLSPGVTYQIDLEGVDTNAGTLGEPRLDLCLWDSTPSFDQRYCNRNALIASGENGIGRNAQVLYTPPASGVGVRLNYALFIDGVGEGTYRLSITIP